MARALRTALVFLRGAPRRWPLLVPAAACLVATALLLGIPFQFYWAGLVEGLHLYERWPLALIGCAAFFVLVGWRRHRNTGRGLFSPFVAALVLGCLLVATWALATAWAWDWSVRRSVAGLGLLAVAASLSAAGVVAYTEVWRLRRWNRAVAADVRRAISDNRLLVQTKARLARPRFVSWLLPPWGSPHCLELIQGEFDSARAAVVALVGAVTPGGAIDDVLRYYERAGETLVAYLRLRWPNDVLSPTAAAWRIAEVRREMLTLALWFARATEPLPADTAGKVRAWAASFHDSVPGKFVKYRELLGRIFDLRFSEERATNSGRRGLLRDALSHFDKVVDEARGGPPVAGLDLPEVCAATWVALTAGLLPERLRFDVWREMCRRQGRTTFPPAAARPDTEPAEHCALAALRELFATWRGATHPDWASPLEGRVRYLTDQEKRSQGEAAERVQAETDRQRAEERARRTPSWPYRSVWGARVPFPRLGFTLPGWALAALLTLLLEAGAYALVACCNPRLPGNPGWNSVAAFSDPRPVGDYSRGGARAMALSGEWLLLVTPDGRQIVVNAESRVPREDVPPAAARDVTAVPARSSFLVLHGDESVREVTPRFGDPFATAPWLAAPAHAVWPFPGGRGPEAIEVVANEYDPDDGWVVAVKGLGFAVYELSRAPGDQALLRPRSWRIGAASELPLERAQITRDFAWAALAGGGLVGADRRTLAIDPRRRRDTPPVRHLEAAYDGGWAAAVDVYDGCHLCPAGDRGWQGPFFGRLDDSPARLHSLADVTAARLHGFVAWLGTDYGPFVYDFLSRRFVPLAPGGAVRALLPLPAPEERGKPAAILAATEEGIGLVRGPNASRRFETTVLDRRPVSAADLSPDGGLCVYLTPVGGGQATELRALRGPISAATPPDILVPGAAWRDRPEAPRVVGILKVGDRLAFATTQGAFLHHPATHNYDDCSEAVTPPAPGKEENKAAPARHNLTEFTSVCQGATYPLAAADGLPLVLEVGEKGEARWRCLQESPDSPVRQVAEAGGRAFGLGGDATLTAYGYPAETGARPYCSGSAPSLTGHPPIPGKPIPGDLLLGPGGDWTVALLIEDAVCTWNSADASMKEAKVVASAAKALPARQLRLTGGGPLLLGKDGTVRVTQGHAVFGAGAFPFSPGEATAAAAGDKGLLLAGGAGHVAAYDWTRGAATIVGDAPVPTDGADAVVEVQAAGEAVLARLRSGGVHRAAWAGGWKVLPGVRHWAVAPDGSAVWFAGEAGVSKVSLRGTATPPEATPRAFCTGAGMKAFVEKASFAWPLLEGQAVAFLGRGPEVGLYDARAETWQVVTCPHLREPSQFAVDGENGLVVLDTGRVLRFEAGAALQKNFQELPATLTSFDRGAPAALHVEGLALKVAHVREGAVTLSTWADLRDAKAERHAGRGGPVPFDPGRVVLATELDGGRLLLVDDRGAVAAYALDEGRLSLRREARTGEAVAGWLGTPGRGPFTLLLTNKEGTGAAVAVTAEGQVGEAVPLAVAPDGVAAALSSPVAGHPALPLFGDWIGQADDWRASAAKGWQARLARPANGDLLTGRRARVSRRAGATSFRVHLGGTWRDLHPRPNGFAEDTYADVAFTASGRLWALQGDGTALQGFPAAPDGLAAGSPHALAAPATGLTTIPTGHVRVHGADGAARLLGDDGAGGLMPVQAAPEKRLATLRYKDLLLDWSWQDGRPLTATWRGLGQSAPPVWSRDGRLAPQSASDVALPDGHSLLVATEAGLFVRDPETFAIREMRTEVRGARFLRTLGGDRTVVLDGAAPALEWLDGQLREPGPGGPRPLTSSLPCGPWTWHVRHDSPDAVTLTVAHRDGRPRRWKEYETGRWKFADDQVRWLARAAAGAELWLATDDGLSLFGAADGRAAGRELLAGRTVTRVRCPTDDAWWWQDGDGPWQSFSPKTGLPGLGGQPPAVEYGAGNVALRAGYGDGLVTLTPFDGDAQPAFAGGRFFFDNASEMAGTPGGLYLIAGARCVVARDPSDPARLTGCWRLPGDLPPGLIPDLESRGGHVYFTACSSDGATRRAWEIAPDAPGARWESRPAEPETVARVGVFAWRRVLPSGPYEPYALRRREAGAPDVLEAPDGSAGERVEGWWDRDRFAWDRVRAAGALTKEWVLLVTPLGPLALRLDDGGAARMTALWPAKDLVACRAARDQRGVAGGLLLSGGDGVPRFLAGAGVGSPTLGADPDAARWLHRPRIELGRWDESTTCSLRETWAPDRAGSPAFRLSLGELPEGLPLVDGQFAFDRAAGAAESDAGTGAAWLTFTPVSGPGGPGTLVCQNHLDFDDRLPVPQLCLGAIDTAAAHLRAVRPGGDRKFLAVFQGPEDRVPLVAHFDRHGRPFRTWLPVSSDKAAPAFRDGAVVSLRLSELTWQNTPTFVWDRKGPPFVTDPPGYGPFVRHGGGLALRFDVFTSLSLRQEPDESPALAVGTRGGVLLVPVNGPPGPRELAPPNVRLLFPQSEAGDLGPIDVERVRYDGAGRLWARFAGQTVATHDAGGWGEPANRWASDGLSASGQTFRFPTSGGVRVGSRLYLQSNDAWGIGRRPMGRVVDVCRDDARGAVWVCTESDGVFKVLPSCLPGD